MSVIICYIPTNDGIEDRMSGICEQLGLRKLLLHRHHERIEGAYVVIVAQDNITSLSMFVLDP